MRAATDSAGRTHRKEKCVEMNQTDTGSSWHVLLYNHTRM